jgi:transglutaminase-like putative cysteine protease
MFIDTADGEPIKAQVAQNLGAFEQKQAMRFEDDQVTLLTLNAQNQVLSRKTMPLPEQAWLPPAAAGRYAQQQIEAGNKQFDVWTLDPTSGAKPIKMTIEVLGREKITIAGKTVPATKTQVSTQITPMTSVTAIEYLDEDGIPVRQTVNMAGVQMELEAADKALALSQKQPVELLNDTLIQPAKPIRNPRELRQAEFVIKSRDGRKLVDLPDSPVQQVKRIDDRTLRVTLDLDRKPLANLDAAKPAIEQSRMIDGSDKRIVALTEKALKGVPDDPAKQAAALREFVYDYIDEKSLGVGMASATEVAQTREGDCTEHAVLLAAMMRAAGIPSRVASGLIYVDESGMGLENVFGFHAWAQAWIDGRWVDYDGVLPGNTDYDAAHILMRTSQMADGQWVNDLVDLAPLIGGIDIEVLRTGKAD